MDENSFSLPRPKYEKKVANKDRIYFQISLVSRASKRQTRRKLENISDNVHFKVWAEKWKNKKHKYNKIFGIVVDWGNSDKKLAHKSCKGTFFKYFYLNSQPLIPSTPKESEVLLTLDVSSTDQSLRKSSRESLQYKSH